MAGTPYRAHNQLVQNRNKRPTDSRPRRQHRPVSVWRAVRYFPMHYEGLTANNEMHDLLKFPRRFEALDRLSGSHYDFYGPFSYNT
jgi:hypothetical protein